MHDSIPEAIRGQRTRRSTVSLLILLVLTAAPAFAQESWELSKPASADDVSSIDGIIDAFYDVVSGPAGEPRDWARDSSLYLPGVRFTVVSRAADGQLAARSFDHGTWAEGSKLCA